MNKRRRVRMSEKKASKIHGKMKDIGKYTLDESGSERMHVSDTARIACLEQ
jgi:hypothetical protein